MAKTMLVSGPASAGKTSLIRTLAGEHPDHHWHLVHLERSEGAGCFPPLRAHTSDWAGFWYIRYQQDDVLATLPDLVQRILAEEEPTRTIVAFEAGPDPILRHAFHYDLRVFVVPPIQDEHVLFRSPEESREALRQILRDSSTFTAETAGLEGEGNDEPDPLQMTPGSAIRLSSTAELNESQIARFLAGPLGAELAARVHLQPRFSAIADANLVVLNTAAAESFSESDMCWQRLLSLLDRLHKSARVRPLAFACDLSDPQDPGLVRILHRMGESLCRV